MNSIYFIPALYSLYPQITRTVADVAYDENGAEVIYDIDAVNAKAIADESAAQTAKNVTLAKLAALGLTQDEVKALVG
jgi:hypothetical protein